MERVWTLATSDFVAARAGLEWKGGRPFDTTVRDLLSALTFRADDGALVRWIQMAGPDCATLPMQLWAMDAMVAAAVSARTWTVDVHPVTLRNRPGGPWAVPDDNTQK